MTRSLLVVILTSLLLSGCCFESNCNSGHLFSDGLAEGVALSGYHNKSG